MDWPSGLPDEIWEEFKQEVPTKEEPFIKKYMEGQASLIAQEQKQRSGKSSVFVLGCV